MIGFSLLLFCMAGLHGVRANRRLAQARGYPDDFPITKAHVEKRSLGPTTCGSSSDVTRSAQEGWQCVVDTRDGLWGVRAAEQRPSVAQIITAYSSARRLYL